MVNKLARYIERHALTQMDFAAQADVPAPMVSLWTRGLRKPGRDNALKIERATAGEVPAEYWGTLQTTEH